MMLVTKILLFILFLALIDVLREAFYFCMCFKYQKEYKEIAEYLKKSEELKISNTRTILLWCSISYVLTIIFKGL